MAAVSAKPAAAASRVSACNDADGISEAMKLSAKSAKFLQVLVVKDPAKAIMPNLLMWQALWALAGGHLRFGVKAIRSALESLSAWGLKDANWQAFRSEEERADWLSECAKRFQSHAQLIGRTGRRGQRPSWLVRLFEPPQAGEPSESSGGASQPAPAPAKAMEGEAGDDDDGDYEEGEEETQEEDEEEEEAAPDAEAAESLAQEVDKVRVDQGAAEAAAGAEAAASAEAAATAEQPAVAVAKDSANPKTSQTYR